MTRFFSVLVVFLPSLACTGEYQGAADKLPWKTTAKAPEDEDKKTPPLAS